MPHYAAALVLLSTSSALGWAPHAALVRPAVQRSFRAPSSTRLFSFDGDRSIGAPVSPGGFNSAGEAGIEIRGFSLAKAFLGVGLTLTTVSFAEYFFQDGGAGLSSLGFIYGIPLTLIGCSLQYAELGPAGVKSTPATEALFEAKATETMQKIVKDTTRHRYGDEAHLDTTVKALGLVLPQKAYPQLKYIEYAAAPGGELSIMPVFQSLDTPFRIWAEAPRVAKMEVFFGPDVWCEVIKVSGEDKMVGVKITTGPRPEAAPAAAEAAEAVAA